MATGSGGCRIGVLGGTFDPVHNGHLAVAEDVLQQFRLAQVVLVPAARPWMKEGRVRASAQDRLAMVELAVAARAWLRVSRVDIDRPGLTYSFDTLADIRATVGEGAEIHFVVGADTLTEMARWRQPERIFGECTVVAVGRPGHGGPDGLPEGHPGRKAEFITGPGVDISASDIRRRVACGESIAGMVLPEVEQYIRDHGLYRATEE